ncbi:MAG: DUF4082 domain-containing protein [Bryobacterales bacterium]|nr:DUF4082 domain-containing protein [Bryobacterales bacterium]
MVVTANLNAISKSASVGLSSGNSTCPCSIWSPSTTTTSDTYSSLPIELGLKFRSKVPGYVLGVRFYKRPGSTGSHTGKLWTKGGTLLASVIFSNETAAGWQQASFSTPVAISANTTYIISYSNPIGRRSYTGNYLQASGVTNGPLEALREGADGGNGLYGYSSSAVPTGSYKGGNNWVDVVFNTVASATPTATSTGPELTTQSTAQRSGLLAAKASGGETRKAGANSLSCSPKSVHAGESFTCQLQLDGDDDPSIISLAASTSDVRLPATVRARAQQRHLTFHGSVDEAAAQSTFAVAAGEGSNLVEDEITILASPSPALSVPQSHSVKVGQDVGFHVSARDSSGLPILVSTSQLPAGAFYDQESDRLEWSPASNQRGRQTFAFTATNANGVSSKREAQVLIESGQPVISRAARGLCSPGSVAALEGRWLSHADGELSDLSGSSLELGGTKVHVDDSLAPVLFASSTRVDFRCPVSAPGTDLEIKLETPSGTTAPFQTTLLVARPELLRAPGLRAEQALATIGDTDRIAMIRDFHSVGEPAQPDDLVSFRATGLGIADSYAGSIFVRVGDVDAQVESVVRSQDAAGVFLVQVRIPSAAPRGDDVPVCLELVTADGQRLASNTVTLAIE